MQIYNTYWQKSNNILSIAIATNSFMKLYEYTMYSRIMLSLAIGCLVWCMTTIPYSLIKEWYNKTLESTKKEN